MPYETPTMAAKHNLMKVMNVCNPINYLLKMNCNIKGESQNMNSICGISYFIFRNYIYILYMSEKTIKYISVLMDVSGMWVDTVLLSYVF